MVDSLTVLHTSVLATSVFFVIESEKDKIKDKLKIEFDDNKCVTRRGLSLEDYKIFISQFAEM